MALIEVDCLKRDFTVWTKNGLFRRKRELVQAVGGISFRIDSGEFVGYIGPNGAGKSTTFKMLIGILVPSSGRVAVAGLTPSRDRLELARRMGVMFGQRVHLWWDLPLIDSFEMLKWIYRIPSSQYVHTLARFRELLELDPFIHTPVRQLSLGQRIRGELVAAMLHEPSILFLDEPTIGLDVVVKYQTREFLIEINRMRGTTILLATNDLGDINQLCSRIIVIDKGHIIYDGSIECLMARFGQERTLIVDLEETRPPLMIPDVLTTHVAGTRQWLKFRRDELSAARLAQQIANQAPIVDFVTEEPKIEDVIRRIYLGH